MTPMSMTYHHHVMAGLLREAASERKMRRSASTTEDALRGRLGSVVAVRSVVRQA